MRTINPNHIRNQSSSTNYANVAFNRLQIGDAAYSSSYIGMSMYGTAPLNVYNKFIIYSGSTFDQNLNGNSNSVYVDKFTCNGTYIKPVNASSIFYLINGDGIAENGSITSSGNLSFGKLHIGTGESVTVTMGNNINADELTIAPNAVLIRV